MTFSGDLRRYCILLNTIIVFEGLVLLVRGIQISKILYQWSNILGTDFDISSTTSIILGALLIIFAFFGYMGLLVNGYGMVIIYSVIIFLFSFLMFIYGLYLWIDIQGISITRDQLQKKLDILPPYLLYNLEKDLRCCGIDHFSDYFSENDLEPAESNIAEKNFTVEILPSVNTTSSTSSTGIPFIQVINTTLAIKSESKTFIFEKWHRTKSTSPRLHVFMMFRNAPNVKNGPKKKNFEDFFPKISSQKPIFEFETTEGLKNVTTFEGDIQEADNTQKEFAEWPLELEKNYDGKNLVYDWEFRLKNQKGRWNFSTPWGKINGTYTILPQSCCMIYQPNFFCYGNPLDTWQKGCRTQLDNFVLSINTEISLLFITFSVTLFVAGFALILFKKVIKQKYWFWAN